MMKVSRRTLLKLLGTGSVLGVGGSVWHFSQGRAGAEGVTLENLLPVRVKGLYTDPAGAKVIVLAPERGKKVLRIWIGDPEAMAIMAALKGIPFPRPMTHDLLNTVIKALGGKVERVVISDLRESTFYATIYLRDRKGVQLIDARPSDSIALALRAKAPIFIAPRVKGAMEPMTEGNTPSPRRRRRGIRI